MSSENTKLWDQLGRTDPAHTNSFARSGGFKGTAIKPIWSFRRMTEEFGPCGMGWGVGEPSFQVVPGHDGEVLVYCTASIWYTRGDEMSRTVYGVGGDKVVAKNKYGLNCNDEAFKSAFTDAVTNALKLIGVGADVHMGMFDDSKYVNTMRQEFAEEPPATNPPKAFTDSVSAALKQIDAKPKRTVGIRDDGTRTSYALKNEGAWEKMMFEMSADMGDCYTILALDKLRTIYRQRAVEENWNPSFKMALKAELDNHEARIRAIEEGAAEAEVRKFDAETEAFIREERRMMASNPIMAG